MKKLLIVFAILFVVCAASFAGAAAAEKKTCSSSLSMYEPDPPNSIRVQIDGIWYFVVLDSNGNPVEIIRVPIRE